MANCVAISTAIQYVVMLGVTIVFSVIALVMEEKQKAIFLKCLSGLCWFISGLVHFISGSFNDPLTYGLTSLFVAFGILYFLLAIGDFSEMKAEKVYGFMKD